MITTWLTWRWHTCGTLHSRPARSSWDSPYSVFPPDRATSSTQAKPSGSIATFSLAQASMYCVWMPFLIKQSCSCGNRVCIPREAGGVRWVGEAIVLLHYCTLWNSLTLASTVLRFSQRYSGIPLFCEKMPGQCVNDPDTASQCGVVIF